MLAITAYERGVESIQLHIEYNMGRPVEFNASDMFLYRVYVMRGVPLWPSL